MLFTYDSLACLCCSCAMIAGSVSCCSPDCSDASSRNPMSTPDCFAATRCRPGLPPGSASIVSAARLFRRLWVPAPGACRADSGCSPDHCSPGCCVGCVPEVLRCLCLRQPLGWPRAPVSGGMRRPLEASSVGIGCSRRSSLCCCSFGASIVFGYCYPSELLLPLLLA